MILINIRASLAGILSKLVHSFASSLRYKSKVHISLSLSLKPLKDSHFNLLWHKLSKTPLGVSFLSGSEESSVSGCWGVPFDLSISSSPTICTFKKLRTQRTKALFAAIVSKNFVAKLLVLSVVALATSSKCVLAGTKSDSLIGFSKLGIQLISHFIDTWSFSHLITLYLTELYPLSFASSLIPASLINSW